MKRKIIKIDEAKCTGCGLCIPNCAEGSLAIRDGKAVLIRDALCDGLGACLGHCPEGALQIEERDAEVFDEELVHEHLKGGAAGPEGPAAHAHGCPSAEVLSLEPAPEARRTSPEDATSALSHWPVQLTLLPPTAPFLQGADLLLAADCVPFAYPNFHRDFLTGRAVAVACPKLDNADAHFRKLVELFRQAKPRSVTVLRMEVPCCGGLSVLAAKALEESGLGLELCEIIVSRDGKATTAPKR